MNIIGKSIYRKEALDKVSGKAKYTADEQSTDMLHVKMVISPYGHAKIEKIDTSEAQKVPGVRAILTGSPELPLIGEEIQDRPPIAVGKVRYYGEPVALVVADHPVLAKRAADLIKITYKPLPVVNSPSEALKSDAPLVHEKLDTYQRTQGVYPEPNTNIANRTKIRKGNMEKGWLESDLIVEENFSFSPSDHAAMETRCAIAEIHRDGYVHITSSSQAPFMIKKWISRYFNIDLGKIVVNTPLVGGAYGGKASVQWEILAFLASKATGGRRVKLIY